MVRKQMKAIYMRMTHMQPLFLSLSFSFSFSFSLFLILFLCLSSSLSSLTHTHTQHKYGITRQGFMWGQMWYIVENVNKPKRKQRHDTLSFELCCCHGLTWSSINVTVDCSLSLSLSLALSLWTMQL